MNLTYKLLSLLFCRLFFGNISDKEESGGHKLQINFGHLSVARLQSFLAWHMAG
jgi:hypothetical protein